MAVGYADGGINVFDLDNGQVLFQFNGHKSPVTVLNYSKDGFILVSGGKVSKIQNLSLIFFFLFVFLNFPIFLGYVKLLQFNITLENKKIKNAHSVLNEKMDKNSFKI